MEIPRHHEIWTYISKIKDPTLALLCSMIGERYYKKFYSMNIVGISAKVQGWFGWDTCKLILDRIDSVEHNMGGGTIDYDVLRTMAIISTAGMGNMLSRKNEGDGWEEKAEFHVWRSPDWKRYRGEYVKEVNSICDDLSLRYDTKDQLMHAIMFVNQRISSRDSLNRLGIEGVIYCTIYHLATRY